MVTALLIYINMLLLESRIISFRIKFCEYLVQSMCVSSDCKNVPKNPMEESA